ncbi:hypothetical protein KXD93_15880 [Mucilaginibacter sp. BJC16-A38]|uniref:hypothetical protein n=1 Tax=Mucilaginibacter phenanthrenivorans TaxID=1234842 RepID=UPI00215761A3|nr:hypothetical protein [Mucilaginibacter phenanthrenivorans]MCR8559137.1 hypothetical protein [Mucilaginibacter phenanthrenivorans]
MNIENPIAYSFIMQDEIYLLNKDKEFYKEHAVSEQVATVAPPEVAVTVSEPVTIVAEPEPAYIATVVESMTKPQPVSFNYLGGNKRNFLVIVHYQEHDFMHDKHLTALESTLSRLGFNRDDVAIFNKAKQDAELEGLTAFFKPEKLLIMGKNSLPIGISIELNKLTQISNYPALFTFSFDEMMDSVENKKAFWEQMKQL